MNASRRAYGPFSSLQRQGFGLGLLLLPLLLVAFTGLLQAQCPDEITVLQPISCSGADDGVLTVSLPDGVDGADVYWLIESDTLFGVVQADLGPGSYLAFVPGCPALGVTLNEPFPFFISATVSQLPTCDDPCSGEITVTPNFGAEPVTYSWSHDPTETGSVGSGVCEQVILVSATDDNGCTDQDIVTVEVPPVEVLAFGTDPSCFGFADGEVSAVATGGLGGGFTFDWADGNGNAVGTGANIVSLPSGTYTVTATDSGGCGMSTTVVLGDPPPVSVDLGTTPVSCAGDSDGSAFAVFPGATFYDWTGPAGFAASGADLDSIVGLSPGTYTVLVTAADGCLGAGTAIVTEPESLMAEPFLSSPSCPGLSDGTVGVVSQGGTAPISVVWTLPGGSSATGEFLNGQPAGTYVYTITDVAGCETFGAVELEDPDAVALSLDVTPPPCAAGTGSDAGSVAATVTGGLGPYSASWVDVATMEVIGSGLTLSGLTVGTYGVGIVDQLGCTVDSVVVINGPDSLTVSVLATMPSCFGDSDGAALAVVDGGTPDYSVVWSGDVTPTIAPSISGLGTGEYTVTATDASGCMADVAFILQEPDPLVLDATTTPVGCAGADGTLTATVTGGIPLYSTMWTGPEGNAGSGLNLTDLTAGDYTGTTTDANGCVAEWTGSIASLPPVAVSATVTVVDCSLGVAELMAAATGGDSPLDVVLDGPEGPVPTAEWSALSPGSYVLTATDARGCSADTAWTIDPPLVVDINSVPEGCTGPGEIAVSVEGGTGTYDFNADPVGNPTASDATTATWSGLAAGTYAVSVSDGVCTSESEVVLDGFSLFDWTVIALDYACEASPGAVSVAVQGGAEPISISAASTDGNIVWMSPDTVGLPAGDYVLNVTDGAGCERDTVLTISTLPELVFLATASPITCQGAADGAIVVEAMGGTEPLLLGVNGPNGLLLEPFEGLGAGLYTAGVVDGRGCVADSILVLEEPAAIVVNVGSTPESCEGTGDGAVFIEASGGTAPLTFQWEEGPQDSVWTGLAAGEYEWTVVDAQGCDTVGTVTIESGGGLAVMVDVMIEACDGPGASAAVALSVTGSVDSATVLLGGLPADTEALTGNEGVWTWNGLPAGTYGWTASLGPGCTTADQVEVTLPEPLSWNGLVLQPLCSGDSGQVEAIATGGAAPVDWMWSGVAESGDTLSGNSGSTGPLPDGVYAFTAVDTLGCTLMDTVSIEAASVDLMVDIALVQPSCGGALVGEATLTPSGGLAPYDIMVEGAADSLFLPFLVPGAYPFTLTDSIGCAVEDTVVVESASAFELVADVDSATCANSEDGLILLETVNAVGAAEFTFVGPFGALPSTDSIPDLAAGVYEITALDEAGCPAVLLVSVGAPPPVVVLLDSLDRPSCAGDLDGSLSVTASGGSGAGFDIAWTVDGMPAGTGQALTGIGEGNYAVTVTDGEGCTGDIASIPLVAEGDVTLTVPLDTALCAGQSLSLEAMAEGATDVNWTLPDGTTGVGLTPSVASVPEGEEVWVFTASRLGCIRTDSVQVTGWSLPVPDAGVDQVIPEGGTAGIGGEADPDLVYGWEPELDVVSPTLAATATEALFAATEFVLTATSAEGCTGSDTVFVDVLLELDIPSGFTPNGDGINDRWNLGGLDQYPSAEITLFNRWGDVLLTFGSTDGVWDGTLNGIPVPVGTYYYHIRVNEPALQAEWTGPITLMR